MTRHRIRWIALTVAFVLVAFGVVLAVQHRTEPSTPRLVQAHDPAPTFSLTAIDDRPVASAQLLGKTYVVNFWNSWCIPCRQEEPALKSFYAAHRADADFAMVGIVRDVEGTLTGSRLVVDGECGEVLIPLVAAICTTVDPAAKRIVIDPPDGLIEANARN